MADQTALQRPYSLGELLGSAELFSGRVIGVPLRGYQLEPVRAVVESCLQQRGLEFLWVFPRQSGKDEAIAQLVVYLMTLLQRRGGNIIHVYPTTPQIAIGLGRLEERLENPLTGGRWDSAAKPVRRMVGRAGCTFFSAHPQARAEGATAHPLLIINETQDAEAVIVDRRFTPMRAANNASCLYVGTVRTNGDFLWQVKGRLEKRQAADGKQRVFIIGPETVGQENPAYTTFVANQVELLGREHPLIKSEYFNEPVEAAAGLFPARRRALMQGEHSRRRQPDPEARYVGLIDVGGQDETPTDPWGLLQNPGRDYTVCTIARVDLENSERRLGPTYRVEEVWVDHGSRHFQTVDGQPPLIERLVAFLGQWKVRAVVVDASGVGEGLADALMQRLGSEKVIPFNFARNHNKAGLGNQFLALVETGRFKYFQEGQVAEYEGGPPGSDAWWFFTQCRLCGYELAPGRSIEQGLKWGVSPGATVRLNGEARPVHDDRLLSAALVAEADRLFRLGQLSLCTAAAEVIEQNLMAQIDQGEW